MMASLFAGVSGLRNHQVKMNVIGNNIANINTIGFKTSRVNFQESLVQNIRGAGRPSSVSGGTNPIQMGLGMQVGAIDNVFTQGGLETTGQITDLAIQGAGFFVLGDANNNRFYSRAGAFGFDANANLVDPATGLYVLGKMADSLGNIPSMATTGPITMPFGQQDPAQSTTEITVKNNLNSSASDSLVTNWSPGSSGVNAVQGEAADGVGGTHTISITGAQALRAAFTGANVPGLALSGNDTLGTDLGVTVFDDFQLTIDGAITTTITGLDANSTVQDLLDKINLVSGVTAQIQGGEVVITRTKAGAPADYRFTSSTSINDAVGGNYNIVGAVFGVANGGTFASAGGAASTFQAIDTFVPSRGATALAGGSVQTTLDLVFDEQSGLAIGLSGLGGGGVEISTQSGLAATPVGQELVVDTADTTHSMSISTFDSLGSKHVLTIEFYKSAIQNRWEWAATTLGTAQVTVGGSGYVTFNSDGSLGSFNHYGGASSMTVDPRNGAGLMDVAIEAGTTNHFDGLTGFSSSAHTASIIGQDGYGLGILEKYAIDKAGNISGIFSNGVTRVLAQISLADFSNPAGLNKAGGSMYQESANSGAAIEGIAGSTISGNISSGALESSSVDIAQEFTTMITAQRGFQANARIITTSDTMLDELVNIKR